MCGIVGYVGPQQAGRILLDGLSKLEYRGYDSAGIAVRDNDRPIEIVKAKGRLKVLAEKTNNGDALRGTTGIGHTRWATHGEPNDVNAHPHLNTSGTIAVVHNGIIENYQALKDKLLKKGYTFKSETDTEVVAQLLDYYYEGNALEAIEKVIHRVTGSYALGILFADHPDTVYAVRKDCPLIVGKAEGASFIASDVPAILSYTRDVYYIDNEEIAVLTRSDVSFFSIDGDPITKELSHVDWDANAAEKGGYPHFMLKEMYEQPKAVRDTISPRIKEGKIVIDELGLSDEDIRSIERIHIIACGSAWHVGMTSRYVIEGLTRIPVDVDLASEFKYRNPILGKNDLVIIISQSGETADSLAALRLAKERGVKTLGIVNVVGSSISREADACMYTWAGPEIAVATTKAYSAQLSAMYLLTLKFGTVRGCISEEELKGYIRDLKTLPEQIEMLLNNRDRIQKIAARFISEKDVFFIGRGIDYCIGLEGSLKLKEISYNHSEAYAAGELKHGTISLVEKDTPFVAIATQPDLVPKTVSNIVEVRSRGAYVLAVTNEDNTDIENVADYVIYIPRTNPWFCNSLAIIPLQLFAYYVAVGKGCDVDKPRNLAKSVTVE